MAFGSNNSYIQIHVLTSLNLDESYEQTCNFSYQSHSEKLNSLIIQPVIIVLSTIFCGYYQFTLLHSCSGYAIYSYQNSLFILQIHNKQICDWFSNI